MIGAYISNTLEQFNCRNYAAIKHLGHREGYMITVIQLLSLTNRLIRKLSYK